MTIKTDALVVGAGPCGLFQLFELGLLGIKAHVVDALPHAGGQCAELYPDKPIYDIPAIPVCNALELVANLEKQIEPFSPTFHLNQQVTTVEIPNSDEFLVATSTGTQFATRSIVIAGGVGSFQPQPLRVAGSDALVDRQIFYRVRDPARFEKRNVVVLGGGDSAFDWVLALQPHVRSMTLIHRSDRFRAAPASVTRMQQLVDARKMRFMIGNVTGVLATDDLLQAIEVTKPDRGVEVIELEDLLVFFGLSPKLGPIADWGLNITKNQIETDTERFETNVPGIYAVGDIATYPGKKKLILSGFHEAALAAFAIKSRLNPSEKVALQYTTTSSVLLERLGVSNSA